MIPNESELAHCVRVDEEGVVVCGVFDVLRRVEPIGTTISVNQLNKCAVQL